MARMRHLLDRVRNALRGERARKPSRPFAPAVAPLEDRVLLVFNTTLTATPNILWPPQGRRFYVTAAAHDNDGWNGLTVPVWVPRSLPAPKPKPVAPANHAAHAAQPPTPPRGPLHVKRAGH